MIYIRRDPSLLPEEVLQAAEDAASVLAGLEPAARVPFIRTKAEVWRAFSQYLARMSFGKCWYSESLDPHSFHDVDHFRPKLKAIRDDRTHDEGYPWLAFSWENFRYSAERSNRLSSDEDDGTVVGKGSWFPLLPGSSRACWDDRCEATELPVLLDPTVASDVELLDVRADGHMVASSACDETGKLRAEESIKRYGLNLPTLVSARLRVMREVADAVNIVGGLLNTAADHRAAAPDLPFGELAVTLKRRTFADQPFSRAACAQLRFHGLGRLSADGVEPTVLIA